jgi:hypothetical protein
MRTLGGIPFARWTEIKGVLLGSVSSIFLYLLQNAEASGDLLIIDDRRLLVG